MAGLGRNVVSPTSLAILVAMTPGMAWAQGAGTGQGLDPAKMLQNICGFILGPFGETLGVLGIIGVGLAWMFGRASLGLVAGVIGGIIIMFGAGYLGTTLMGANGLTG